MQAHAGDRLVVRGTHLDDPTKDGLILEVQGEQGAPPYLVRWSDDGHVSLVYPGPDAHVDHLGHGDSEPQQSAER